MLKLPSGRFVDLSTDRAKHHALRQSGVCPESTHRELYPLVDIIYRHVDDKGIARWGWTEFDYEYSGYTLETVRRALDWSDADKSALYRWIRLETQRKRIETARRRLINEQKRLSIKLYSPPQHLYSVLQRRLQKLPLQKASAEQWLATINNMKLNGVREEEIHWSGIRHFLKQHKTNSVISKQQILNNLNFNDIRMELSCEQVWDTDGALNFRETALRMPHQAVYRAALQLDDSCICVLRYVDSLYNYRIGVVKTLSKEHPMALNKFWFALDPYGRPIRNTHVSGKESKLFFSSSIDAKKTANQHAWQYIGKHAGTRPHTQFDHLTLFEGEDYREWLVSLPDHQRVFFGAHFFDHNVLAHIRTTTRTDEQGRRLLFVEEAQSDWHQSGSRYGYDNSIWGRVANAPFKQEWPALIVKLMLIYASQNGFSGIAWTMGALQEMRYRKQLQTIKHHYDREIPRAFNRLTKDFNCQVTSTYITTRDPWLNLEKSQDKWRVLDGDGKFKTRAKYKNREEAMNVIARHCRTIKLEVPALFINDDLRRQVTENGLPLFGETIE